MEMLAELFLAICTGLVFVVIIGFSTERGTQVLKMILRWISAKLNIVALAPSGVGSWILALVISGLVTYGFDINVLSEFEMFNELDPELINIMNMILVWVMAEIEHKKMPKVTPG